MKESLLPKMYTATHDTVLGGIKAHVSQHKMVIVLGEPGEGKTCTVLDFCSQADFPCYYYRCSPNTTMNSMLIFMANAIGTRIVGGNDEVQNRIQLKLRQEPNVCFVFDEAEYLAYGNASKIDVLRQIYDETDVPIVICGTYALKDLISGERKNKTTQTHNRPQIFRRLRKEEFQLIEEGEVLEYIQELEKEYAVRFESNVKNSLISLCRDRQSGGLGNFIEIIELLFSYVRPEWEDISREIIRKTGRVLHTHDELSQSYHAIKADKVDLLAEEEKKKETETNATESTASAKTIDIAQLEVAVIDMDIYKDALHHKMTM